MGVVVIRLNDLKYPFIKLSSASGPASSPLGEPL